METIFFDGWSAILRTLVVGVLAYAALVAVLRVSGKRTLSKWNAFDFIVTIALGSTLATVLLSKTTSLAQGTTALALLVLLQFVITWLSVRVRAMRPWIKAQPSLLVYRGEFLHEALQRERVTQSEVRAAVRGRGIAALEEVEAVVLETDGSFSVIASRPDAAKEHGPPSALVDVRHDWVEASDRRLRGKRAGATP